MFSLLAAWLKRTVAARPLWSRLAQRRVRNISAFMLVLLIIEFMDEFVFGTREAAWPLIRQDLNLTYDQIGLLLAIPSIFASFVEPLFGIWALMGHRKRIIVIGGVVFALSVAMIGLSGDFWALMVAQILAYPASGAFVSLSQTALMDTDPKRHEQNMARWTLAGSLGIVIAPLLLGLSIASGIGWRGQMLLIAVLMLGSALLIARFRMPTMRPDEDDTPVSFREAVRAAIHYGKRWSVIRWFVLLDFSDLMLDGLHGFLALYFVDVVGGDAALGALAVAVWTSVGLIGDILILPLLERVRGIDYLRVSAVVNIALYPAFLLVDDLTVKLALLGLLGISNAGWYSVLQGQVYTALPGHSSAVMSLSSVFGLFGALIPFFIGFVAERIGLASAMWLMMAGPFALIIGLPRRGRELATDPPVAEQTDED